MSMDIELARTAIRERFAQPLGLSLEEAAEGIIRIANEHMAHGIRRMTIQKGLDPREFALMAFGGGGPMFAAEIAASLEIPEVIVPAHPGTTSALGLLAVDTRHDLVRSFTHPYAAIDAAEVERLFNEMEAEARELLEGEGFAADVVALERVIDVRYVGQDRALSLALGNDVFDAAAKERYATQFHEDYEKEFKYSVPDLPIEAKALRLTAIGTTLKPELPTFELEGGDPSVAVTGEQDVWFTGAWHATTFYDRDKLVPGMTFAGPAILEQYDSTTIVPPRTTVTVDHVGNLLLTISTEDR
jgi:N-methylhydantoinase A